MHQQPLNHDDRFPVIDSYRVTGIIYAGSRTLVYRGMRLTDGQSVVLKMLKRDRPLIYDLLQLQNHYIITKNLNLPGVVPPIGLETYGNGFVLVMPDEGYCSLSDYLASYTLNLAEVLAIAIQLTDILHGLYQHRVIHKDIKPANLLIEPESKRIQLIDFGIASLLPKEMEEVKHPNVLEGTLAYLAPEQTGRMNRGVDYRTDFYALGVTLFELLTGQLPFQSDDPLELVHCHIAKQPVPPHQIVGEQGSTPIPQMVSDLVMKLMAKNAEDRYQSALGIKYDLEQCLSQWQTTGSITNFTLGQQDVSDRFLIPEKLYGREQEVQILLAAFERVSRGAAELMLVAGFSGIGKTAVVNEVHKPIVKQRGYFIKGKFDQFNRNIPFSAFVQAFRDLIGQLLSESDSQLAQWRAKILEIVGDSGQVLIEVIPELERVIGQQPPAPELSGTAAQNRFNLLLQKFIAIFATSDHPLVLFLDDLQWVDLASLQLIKLLMEDEAQRYLLLLGAYRHNEVSSAHPFIFTVEELKQSGRAVHTINLTPLAFPDMNQLVADTLHCAIERSRPLTELIDRKTQGNPFFITQFLKALHQDQQLTFNHRQGYWECDIAQIITLSLTDDVVEFVAQQLQKLPTVTQEILKLAACIGNRFDLAALAIISERSETDTAAALWSALQAGLILPQSNVYKFFSYRLETKTNQTDSEVLSVTPAVTYRFLHDRIQQAAYSLIDSDRKPFTHFTIGLLLLQNTPDHLQEERIFEIVTHLNYGIAFVSEPGERQQLAQLNLKAGRKAKEATAYGAASHYIKCGLQLLTATGWTMDHELTRSLYEEAAEIALFKCEFEQMDVLIQKVLQNTDNLLERVKVYEIQLQADQVQGKHLQAIAIGRELLQQFGIELPESLSSLDIRQMVENTLLGLADRKIEDLINLPLMNAPQGLTPMRILASLVPSVYHAAPGVFPILACEQVKLSLQYGNALLSAPGYADFGIVLNSLNRLTEGCQFGQLALKLVEQLQAKSVQSMTIFKVAGFNQGNMQHIRSAIDLLHQSYAIGLETGDFWHTIAAARFKFLYSYLSGTQTLDQLLTEIKAYHADFAATENFLRWSNVVSQSIQNLTEFSESPASLTGEYCDQDQLLHILLRENDELALHVFFLSKLILSYLFEHLLSAINCVEQGKQYLNSAAGMQSVPIFLFYDSLTQLAAYPTAEPSRQAQLLLQVSTNQDQLGFCAQFAPMNFQHKYDLVAAERHRILGNKAEAIDYYERAINGARVNEYVQEEALANELAAKFYLDWGKDKIAADYLQEAYYAYARWGAKAKADHLAQCYPQLLSSILAQANMPIAFRDTQFAMETSSHFSDSLDLNTILKASQVLSSEIQLNQLLQTLIQLVITNAGADKAALFLNQNGALELAIKFFDNAVQSLEPKSIDTCQQISIALIHYVERTLETVITDYKTHPSTVNDPYCLQYQPQSLLCMPILKQGQLVAVLYLENTITANVFTDDRVKLLNVLCAQAAISLENARLYLQSQSYAQQLEQSLTQLQASESRFRHLAANVPGVIYQLRVTAEGLVSMPYVSSACYDLYEVSAEEMMAGKYSFRDFEHIDDRAAIEQIITKSRQTLQPFNLEFRIVTRSGQVKWVQAASQPQRQPDGVLIWDGVVIDISDRKAAEAQIQQQTLQLEQANRELEALNTDLERQINERTQQLQYFVAHTPLAVAMFDRQMNYLVASQQWLKDYNLSDQSIVGKCHYDVFPNMPDHWREIHQRGLNGFVERNERDGYTHPDGKQEWVRWEVRPWYDSADNVGGIIVFGEVITDRVQVEIALEKLNEELEQRVQERTQDLLASKTQLQKQELFLRSIYEGTETPIFVTDVLADGSIQIQGWNSACERLLGITAADARGKRITEVFAPADATRILHNYAQCIQTGKSVSVEELIMLDGQPHWSLTTYNPLLKDDGKVYRIVGTSLDITDRKLAEAKLQENEQFLRSIFDGSETPIFVIDILEDNSFRFSGWNPACATYANISASQVLGKSPIEALGNEFGNAVIANYRRCLEHNDVIQYEECLPFPHQMLWTITTLNPLKNADDRIYRIVGTSVDITDLKQTEMVLRQYERMVSAAPDGIALISQDYVYRLVNQIYVERFGYQQDEIVGHSIGELLGEDALQALIKPQLDRSLAGETVRQEDWFYLKAIGDRYMSVTYSPYIDLDGTISGVIVSTRDETDRKQAEIALRDSEERLRLALMAANQGLYDLNVKTGDAIVSPEYATMLGYDPTTFHETNAKWIERLHPDDSEIVAKTYQAYITGEIPTYKVEFRQRMHNGDWKWILSLGKVVAWDEDGQPLRMLGTHTDISDRKLLEQELRQVNTELEQRVAERTRDLQKAMEAAEAANRAKSSFLANMSHELRTPLNAILGFSQLLNRDHTLPVAKQTQIGIINRSGEHLLNLINDILEMSKIEAGRVMLTVKNFDLLYLLRSLVELFHLKADSKGLNLIMQIDPSVPQYIQTDEGKLRQVLTNLLSNAIKFTQTGSVTLRVQAESLPPEKSSIKHTGVADQSLIPKPQCSIYFAIEDTGPGIDPTEHEILFEPFMQTQTGHKSQEGTGLGLPISRQFVQLMGGDLNVHSIPGRGATFWFEIPVTLVWADDLPVQTSTLRVIGLAPNQPVYRLLVVEDNPDNSQFLIQFLQSIGFEVQEASNGEEAVARWQQWSPHLIWMDMRMPILDGYEATRQIRSLASSAPPPKIIALTASAFEDERAAILAAGCDDMVCKPATEALLVEKLAEHLHVQYLYSDRHEGAKPSNSEISVADKLSATALQVMPIDWIEQLQRAARIADEDLIFKLLEQLPPAQAPLAKALNNLVQELHLDQIIALTMEALSFHS
jgi:PAS domain S-box-containing protein